jgi:acid phosphatase (class A)
VKRHGTFSPDSMVEKLTRIVILLAFIGMAEVQGKDSRIFLPIGSVDTAEVINPPPAEGSDALREQMTVVLWLQRTRTPEQVTFVEEALDLRRFVPTLGAALLEVDGIDLKRTLDTAIDEVRTEYDALKRQYNLRRPFEINEAVKPVGDARPVASYPSGHAIRATVYARLLAEIFPEHRDALLELGRQIGFGRVIAGVHFPIDVVAGQKLGDAYAEVIVNQAAFRNAVAQIRHSPPGLPSSKK